MDYIKEFKKIMEVEPRLEKVYRLAKENAYRGQSEFCPNYMWERILKPELKKVIGWEAENPIISGNLEWDVSMEALLTIVGGMCKGCGCMGAKSPKDKPVIRNRQDDWKKHFRKPTPEDLELTSKTKTIQEIMAMSN